MAKKRIYEMAKEYNISSKAMVNIIKELGFDVKSHSSTADDNILEAVRKRFASEKEEVKKEIEKKKEIAEARKKTEEEETAKRLAIERKMQAEIKKVRKKDIAQFESKPTSKKKKDRRKKKKERVVDLKAVKATFKKTMSSLDTAKKKKYRRSDGHTGEGPETEEDTRELKVNEFITLSELADLMGIKPAVLVAKCMELGTMATINQRLDMDTIGTLALEFGFTVEEAKLVGEEDEEEYGEEDLEKRPPVVTVMGHVDHGKTSLLDFIRESNIIAGESGGITQHIGAYEVHLEGGNITFLDTPGHQAFSAMRARGAHVTDIVVLVVAADDAVMPQTVEAIDHARAAGVPIIVAINKIDLPTANVDKIKEQLSKHNLISEDWGGKTVMVEISAKTGRNVDKLLEMILLQTEMMDLKAVKEANARGTVIESKLDRGKGPLCTVLIEKGTLSIGDSFVAGTSYGRVRAMFNERGSSVEEAPPSTPVMILGSGAVPQAGDPFSVVDGESEARTIAQKRLRLKREKDFRHLKRMTLNEVYDRIKEGQIRELHLIIKGDVDGSVEALSDTLARIQHPEVKISVIRQGVGAISESDVLLAAASEAVIIGFHVRAESKAAELAVKEKVDIRTYKVIYEAESDIKAALEGLLAPEIKKIEIGEAEVRQIFRVPRMGAVAGSYVKSGSIKRGSPVEIYRNEELLGVGSISSLKRFKEDVREVSAGYECGIGMEPFPEIMEGDIIRVYQEIEEARKLN